ncbi:low temperature requirement protein A [Streptomyces sp. NBC_00566]|uniref:low temperature requirement protein A n=1 Tax=Streptomyces sp. NBC_00566 TaxID=2975778 RepID=UPI002E80F844|nr:low temperature requirement protein A [Streptomyces sp. NBC_00566]WUB88052.1 low temperature requirement protein A [Streptomyces sp. NBC_00566]
MNHPQPSGSAWRRPMVPRLSGERHRTATVLELFFDLCFVTAVAQTAAAFEHELAGGKVGHGVLGYALVFFAIWWAWMNFTWFASAYDTDDVPYRLLTLLQIAGALVLAAGASKALEHYDFRVITYGYVVMRLAMVSQWLRAARSDPERRRTCLRYAVGILVVQIGWVVRLALPDGAGLPSFFVLVVAELAVPAWAERAGQTTWHPHHIAERYGLFTLIVLGESITAATATVRAALDTEVSLGDIAPLAVGGILTVFAMWWLYFTQSAAVKLNSLNTALRWGYGHYFVFASAAAVGAGLAVEIAHLTGHAHLGRLAVAAAYTVPVALYIAVLRLLHRGAVKPDAQDAIWAVGILAVLAVTFTPSPVLATGCVASALVAAVVTVTHRARTSIPQVG